MTNWYRAICDEHKEICGIFCVSSTVVAGLESIKWPLGPGGREAAQEFLREHYTCKLRLVRDDNEDDPLGYTDKTPP